MAHRPTTWRLERNAPMRADADSIFVPAAELPEARVGDRVTISGADEGDERVGTVVELVPDREETALRVALDSPR